MTAFFGGLVFGCLLMGGAFAISIPRIRAPRREIVEWAEATYQKPTVTTRILIHERHMEL
jgi:hypothetical protein